MNYNIEITRSKRRTLGLEIKPDGRVIPRVPMRMKQSEIDRFIGEKSAWIEKHLQKLQEAQKQQGSVEKLNDEDIQKLADKALEYIPKRVE